MRTATNAVVSRRRSSWAAVALMGLAAVAIGCGDQAVQDSGLEPAPGAATTDDPTIGVPSSVTTTAPVETDAGTGTDTTTP